MHLQPHWRQHRYVFLKMIWWASFCLASSSPRELQYSGMSERNTLWCVITNQNTKSQGSNLHERLHSLFRKPEMWAVRCNIHGSKPATSGGPAEHPQWCQRSLTLPGNVADILHKVSHPSTHSQSLCQHQGPGSAEVKPDDSQEMDAQQMKLWLSQAYPNTPTHLPPPGAKLRVANSCSFTACRAILAVFQGMVALKSSV